MARTLDPAIDDAIATATLGLLEERGFAATTVEDVAARAGVGKPAIYRRHRDKAALVVAAIARRLPQLEVPDLGDTRRELWLAVQRGFPPDAAAYLRVIGGLAAAEPQHPELIATFREHLLGPRRAIVLGLIERGQDRGDVRRDVGAETLLDHLGGALLARAFAGLDTGPRWRRRAFDGWWTLIDERRRST